MNGDYIKALTVILSVFFLSVAALASSEEEINFGIDEALELTDCVFIAELGAIIDIPMSYIERTEYYFNVIDVAMGPDSLSGKNAAVYLNRVPGYQNIQPGEEEAQALLLTGSGYEIEIEEGDTVVVFSKIYGNTSSLMSLIRIEPALSWESIRSKIVHNQYAEN